MILRFISLFFVLNLLLSGCGQLKLTSPKRGIDFFKVLWSKNLDTEYISGNLPISVGAPRIFQDIVYMGNLSGIMHAYDSESGRLLWSHQEKTALGGPVEFFKDHVAYGGANGRLFVRHYLTGKLKYAIDLGAPIESAPVFYQERLVVYLRGHQLVNLDAESGKILWVYKRAVPVSTTLQRTTKPLILGNKIIVGFADGFVGALSVEEGLLLWETKVVEQGKFVDVDLNPVLVQGTIITGSPSGELKALNPDSGSVAKSFNFNVQSHPVLKGDVLAIGTVEGELILLSIGGEVIKKAKISPRPISAVTWWKDHLVAASFDGKIRSVDLLTFTVQDEFALGSDSSAVYSDLVENGNYLAVFSSRNRLYLFH